MWPDFNKDNTFYILDDRKRPLLAKSWEEYHKYMEKYENKVVKKTIVPLYSGGIVINQTVSTVFLGMDHGAYRRAHKNYVPTLWETMIFGGPEDGKQHRYTSEQGAIMHHDSLVTDLKLNII